MASQVRFVNVLSESMPTLDDAVVALEAGEVVIIPTDTVYGVAAHFDRPEAIEQLFELKGRDRSKALAVLAADAGQARALFAFDEFGERVRGLVDDLMADGWPGALTVVGPRAELVRSVDLGGDKATIGVRVPASPLVRAIADAVGPIVTTSANRSGQPTPVSAAEAARSLAGSVATVIDGGPGGTEASTVIDVTAVPFRVIRQGGYHLKVSDV